MCCVLPSIASSKCLYTHDLALATYHQSLGEGSSQLMRDFEIMHKHYIQWCLELNPEKWELSAFHLTIKLAHKEGSPKNKIKEQHCSQICWNLLGG